MKTVIIVLGLIGSIFIAGCCTKAGCDFNFPYRIVFNGFDSSEMNNVTIISYKIDKPNEIKDSITGRIFKDTRYNEYNYSLGAKSEEYNYKIRIHNANRDYEINNYIFGKGQRCNKCFPQKDMYQEELKSYYLNGTLKNYDKGFSFHIDK